ncbi:1657_t:CDS:2 [Dentiscutata erythropus]|uniref:1657_t:CDS:1 n=1 Tax=Dentiscutata erythropus TaxID=1348616 RepID=A0A9N9IPZ6_9GLOM|nr:1657_t:CDS:2 [Dentiscutata erythropus]
MNRLEKPQTLSFEYNVEHFGVIFEENFENKLFLYLKKNKLHLKKFTFYQFNGGKLLHKSTYEQNEKLSLQFGKIQIIYDDNLKIAKDRTIENIDFYRNGYPLYIQAKFRNLCTNCKNKNNKSCSYNYYYDGMKEDILKFDKKLSEYKIPIFGMFIVNEFVDLPYSKIKQLNLKNQIQILQYSDALIDDINELGNTFLRKDHRFNNIKIKKNFYEELKISSVYWYFESYLNKINNSDKFFYDNLKIF